MVFQTATNPDTGERLILVNDAWQKIEKSATNEAGAKAYLVKGNWLTPEANATPAAPSPYGSAVPQVTPEGKVIRQPDAIPEQRPSMGDVLVGTGETARAIIQGIPAGIVAPIAGVARSVTGGQYGTPEGVRQGQELAGRVQQSIAYQPKTPTGQAMTGAVSEFLEPLGAIPFSQGVTAATLAPGALRQTGNIARTEAGLLKQAIGEIPAVKAAGQARVAESYARGPQIDATNLAQKYGISLDPAVSNPNLRNKARTGLIGSVDLDNRLSADNKPKWTNIVKKDLGVGDEVSLTDPKIYDKVRARDDIAGPYETVRNIKQVIVDTDSLKKLDKLRAKELYVDDGQAAQVGAYLDDLKEGLLKGGDGTKLLDTIRQMRQQASDVFRAVGPLDPNAKAMADAKIGAAKVLESLIDNNLPNAKAREAFVNARTRMAQTYDMESATNFGTGQIDPNVFAKLVSKGEPVTGVVADIGKIASNFPEISALSAGDKRFLPAFTRAGPGGAIGGLIGLSAGPAGVPFGIAAGAGMSEIIRRVAANKMTSPEFQSSRAVPKDYRPEQPVNALRPVESRELTVLPSAPRNDPNFVMRGNETVRMPFDPNRPDARQPMGQGQQAPANALRLGMTTKENELGLLQARKDFDMRMAQMAETEGLAAEARSRAPTSREVILDVDPVTGKLLPASQGIRGATPETFQDYTSTLRSATNKISSGQKFTLDAAEKVAFDKTRVDLAEVAPGFKALNDRAIADKMMDRNWVEETLKTARQKDAAFAEIESRARSPEMMGARADSAKNAEMLRQATEARDRVKSSIELLEDQLRQMRPDTSRKTQGPKTRAAKLNALRGDDEILNKLVP
jgi:hypothetical protein